MIGGLQRGDTNLLIQKTFRQQAKVSTPGHLPPPIDLKERDVFMPVDLVPWRVDQRAFGPVSFEHHLAREEHQAKLANVQQRQVRVLGRVWAEIPSLDFMFTDLEPV